MAIYAMAFFMAPDLNNQSLRLDILTTEVT